MKRMTTIAILIFAVTQISNAGWLSSIGQRIVNGAVNTVQTNISSKVNRTIDNAMDGKLAPQKKNSSQSHVDEYSGNPGLPNPGVSVGGPAIVETQGSTYRGERGKALPFTGRYEQIDLGITKFTGERIYGKTLKLGETHIEVNEFLNPGYYLIWIVPGSTTESVSVDYDHESEGITFGYGIEAKQTVKSSKNRNMILGRDEMLYVVEVLPNTQGHVEFALMNNQNRTGSGQITIFKIPGPKLK
jgi:hypothetical protein